VSVCDELTEARSIGYESWASRGREEVGNDEMIVESCSNKQLGHLTSVVFDM
jgi:hypothetical protein